MSTLLTVVATVATVPVVVPLAVLVAELWAGLPRRQDRVEGDAPRTVVLIPAHDEAAGIARTIATVRADAPTLDVLVVADNCGDDTAAVARGAGARVVERHDPIRRGKGFALACGRDALRDDPPAVVVVLDADCTLSGQAALTLATISAAVGRAVQARNLQRPRGDHGSAAAQVSDFAFLVKNLVRQRGALRLGGLAVLTGTGMAIPWSDLRDAPLATGDLAEDLTLGIWLTRQGRPPRYTDVVEVLSDPAPAGQLDTQRRRWEHGFRHAARRHAFPLVAAGLARGSRPMAWLGLHLLVPPLALLMAAALGVTMLVVALARFGASVIPAAVMITLLGAAGLGLVLAWRRYGRAYLAGRTLLAIPGYILAKLALHRRRETEWRRTGRPGEP